jgi:hypothetical protein
MTSVRFLGVRGSREPFDPTQAGVGPTLARLAGMLGQRLSARGTYLQVTGVAYPARPWRYRRNRELGVTALCQLLTGLCDSQDPIVLAGLSQGADVIRHALAAAAPPAPEGARVVAIILLGDPGRTPQEPYERGSADSFPGILARSAPPLPERWHQRTWSYCLAGDEVCANRRGALGLLRSGTHTHYALDREEVLTQASAFAFAQTEPSLT